MTHTESTTHCPVCGSLEAQFFAHARDLEYYTSTNTFSYLQCNRCRSVFLESPPVDELDKIYPPNYYSYDSDGAQSHSLVQRIKEFLDARLFRTLLERIPGDALSALDVGGGSGWLLSIVRKVSRRVRETHEVDLNENVRTSAESAGHVFHCCRIEEFSPGRTFDFILLLNLIEHVADPAAVLRAMRQLLSAHGLILIKTPNVETLDCRIFRHRNWGGFHCPRHFVLFNQRSLTDLGQRCGLRVFKMAYTQGAPQWTASILGWLAAKHFVLVSAERPLYKHPLYPVVSALAAAFDLLRSPFVPTAQMFIVFQLDDPAS